MKLLVLGGTKFLGRHAVAAALDDGHDVTIFTRGQTNPELFPEVEHLHGNRDGDLDVLHGGAWDGVIDASGYVPRVVRQSAELLRDRVGRYVFVSSISVYADFSRPITDATPVAELEDPATEEVTEHYGALKAACERVVEENYDDRSARVRAGLIVGPYDPTDRFTYWPRRIAAGGDVLAPGDPASPVQFVDARDLGAWLVKLALRGPGGDFDATGPTEPLTLGELFERARAAIGSDASFVWTDSQRIREAEVQPWTELPLWLPNPDFAGMCRPTSGLPSPRASSSGRSKRRSSTRLPGTAPFPATGRPCPRRRSARSLRPADRIRIKREPQRGRYDRETIEAILDEALLCHVGFEVASQPYVIPTLHARVSDKLYVHGSAASRLLRHAESGAPVCATVTLFDGLVLAKSVFNHSVNYRSAVVFGTATLVDGEEKREALPRSPSSSRRGAGRRRGSRPTRS
jgi:2'-hydroxyisoflavone reductase